MSFRDPKPVYSESYIREVKGGATVHSQIRRTGYGFTEYQIVGTMSEVSLAVDSILSSYPNMPYGTWFNWPPNSKKGYDGSPNTREAAIDLGNGLWHLTGSHSNTSD